MGVGSADDTIAFDAGIGNLTGNVTVAQTYNQTILRCVVLILVLEDQAFPGIVIGLTLTTPLELNLITLKVLLVLYNLNETLKETQEKTHITLLRQQHFLHIGPNRRHGESKNNIFYRVSFFESLVGWLKNYFSSMHYFTFYTSFILFGYFKLTIVY